MDDDHDLFDLVAEVLRAPPAERDAALARLCGKHPPVAGELRELCRAARAAADVLAADGHSGGAGEAPTVVRLGGSLGTTDLDDLIDELRAAGKGAAYAAVQRIARGGMALIELVWDPRFRRLVASKVFPIPLLEVCGRDARRRLARFLDEAYVTSQLQHPAILPVLDFGLDAQGRPFFTMPFVRGEHLGRLIRRMHGEGDPNWSLPRVLGVLERVCEVMAYAHNKGVIHRDLKPSNVMVGRFGETYVMDWGLAKVQAVLATGDAHATALLSPRLREGEEPGELRTLEGEIVGTPVYMAPEQAAGALDRIGRAADVYALGAVLYEVLSGRPPFGDRASTATPAEMLEIVRTSRPRAIQSLGRSVPAELVAICERAMTADPAQRYPSMAALGADLRAFLDQRVVSAYRTGAVAELGTWLRRNRVVATLAGLLLVVALAAGVAVLVAERGRRNTVEESNVAIRAAHAEAQQRAELLRRAVYRSDIGAAQRKVAAGEAAAARKLLLATPMDLRRIEWQVLMRAADQSKVTFPWAGRLIGVSSFAVSRDGRLVALGGTDGRVIIHRFDGGEPMAQLQAPTQADALAFSPDGTSLASRHVDRLRFWDVASGAARGQAGLDRFDQGFRLAYADGSRVVLNAARDLLTVHDAQSGARVASLQIAGRWITALAAAPDERHVCVLDEQGAPHFVETQGWKEVGVGTATGAIGVLADFDADSLTVWVGDDQGAVRRCAVPSGEVLEEHRIRATEGAGLCRAIDPTRRFVAFVDQNRAGLADLRWGDVAWLRGHEHPLIEPLFAAGGTLLTRGRKEVRAWDPVRGRWPVVALTTPGAPSSIALASDGAAVAATCVGSDEIFVCSLVDMSRRTRKAPAPPCRVAFSPCGRRLATAGHEYAFRVWDAGTLEPVEAVERRVAEAWALAYSPDGRWLFVGTEPARLTSWSNSALWRCDGVAGGGVMHVPTVAHDAAFAADSSRFAVVGEDGCVRLFDPDTREQTAIVSVLAGRLESVAWSPNGRFVYTAGRYGTIHVVDVDAARVTATMKANDANVSAVRVVGDDRLISAHWGGRIGIWDLTAAQEIVSIAVDPAYGNWVTDLEVSADGRVLAAGVGPDEGAGRVLVWFLDG